MIIKKGDTRNVTPNFKANEFYSTSPDAPNEHYISDEVIEAAQYLRTYFNTPVNVNSSFRTPKHNAAIGGASRSQHLKGTALDLSFPNNPNALLILKQDILNEGEIFTKLYSIGIHGFGLYDNFQHIDSRPNAYGNTKTKNGANYTTWDRRVTSKKKCPA